MKLIVGFGNPEQKYNFTRHNFGFLALDFYTKVKDLKWEEKPRYNAIWLKTKDFILIKPQTYYNESGQAVQAFANFYKIKPEDILIVCDDFNLPFGELRYRKNGSAGGNNGLKSVIASLNTTDFPRLRLGTGNDTLRNKIGDMEFVLSKFTPEEKAALPDILNDFLSKLDHLD